MKRWSAGWLATAVAALSASGCFSYFPPTLETVPPGDDVRIFVSPAGMAEVSELPVGYPRPQGVGAGPMLQGTLVRREGDGILLHVPVASRAEGFYRTTIGQERPDSVARDPASGTPADQPLHHGLRVAGTTATAATVLTFTIRSFTSESRVPTEEDQMRLPIFSFSIR